MFNIPSSSPINAYNLDLDRSKLREEMGVDSVSWVIDLPSNASIFVGERQPINYSLCFRHHNEDKGCVKIFRIYLVSISTLNNSLPVETLTLVTDGCIFVGQSLESINVFLSTGLKVE